jgi:hypothetical protein
VFWISGNLDEAFGWASARDTAAAQSPRRMPAVLWTPGVRLTFEGRAGRLAVQELEQGVGHQYSDRGHRSARYRPAPDCP